MTEEQKAKFWELASESVADFRSAEKRDAVEAYVAQLTDEAYQAGRKDERKAVRLWGVK
jgi:histone H3/H4